MEIAILMLVSVTLGYLMGRQATKDKQHIKDNKPLERFNIPSIPNVLKKDKEPEKDLVYEGLMNILSYEGENQHAKE